MSKELQRLACSEKTPEVVEDIITRCYPLLMSQLRKFYLYNDPDALSHAYEALHKAICSYSATGGSKFITYATVCIYNGLGSYLRMQKNEPQAMYLHDVVSDNGEELIDMLPIDIDVADDVIGDMTCSLYKVIAASLIADTTNKNQKSILSIWYASEFEMKHAELAKTTGVAQSYVTQTINTFRAKFKKELGTIGHRY